VISCGRLDCSLSSCTSATSVLRFWRLAWGYICCLWISGGHTEDLCAMRLAQYSSVLAKQCMRCDVPALEYMYYIWLRCLFYSSMRENRHLTSKPPIPLHRFHDRLCLFHYRLIEGNKINCNKIICNKILYISHFSSKLICPNPNPVCNFLGSRTMRHASMWPPIHLV
jgi:hypothetical protein